jgi:hypothetical protein
LVNENQRLKNIAHPTDYLLKKPCTNDPKPQIPVAYAALIAALLPPVKYAPTTVPSGASPTDTPFVAHNAFKPAKIATEVAAVIGSAIFSPLFINLLP